MNKDDGFYLGLLEWTNGSEIPNRPLDVCKISTYFDVFSFFFE